MSLACTPANDRLVQPAPGDDRCGCQPRQLPSSRDRADTRRRCSVLSNTLPGGPIRKALKGPWFPFAASEPAATDLPRRPTCHPCNPPVRPSLVGLAECAQRFLLDEPSSAQRSDAHLRDRTVRDDPSTPARSCFSPASPPRQAGIRDAEGSLEPRCLPDRFGSCLRSPY